MANNGVAFDPKYEDKLFTQFQCLHPENEFPGTGIGLGAADLIIRRHKGWIWSDSKVGEGDIFYFSFEPASDQATSTQTYWKIQHYFLC